MVPLQVLFAFGVALDDRARPLRRRRLPHDLLPARARAPGGGDAGLRLHPQPGDRAREQPARHLGINGPLWFQDPTWAKPSLVMLGVWGDREHDDHLPRGRPRRPADLYESSEIDGAGALQRMRYVTLPSISPVILFSDRHRDDPGPAVLHAGVRRRDVASGQASQAGDQSAVGLGYPENSTLMYPVLLYQDGFRRSGWATRRRSRSCCSSSPSS